MKKAFTFLFFAVLILSLTSCRYPKTYELLESTEAISEISVVQLSFDENSRLIENELSVIDDRQEFINSFRKIDCYVFFGDPLGVTPTGVEAKVIKIAYESGEYELINWQGQAKYTADGGFRYYAGYSVFDQEQFERLINHYTTE